ncbi:MAG: hypothetical protein R3F31_24855 [Verrucomicrobiales bacterium]
MAAFNRTKDNPLPLKTPPGTADFAMHTDTKDGTILVCTVVKTVLHYDARCIEELHAMLQHLAIGWPWAERTNRNQPRRELSRHGAALPQGILSEAGMGSRKDCADALASTSPPLWKHSVCELEHNPRDNRIRAK